MTKILISPGFGAGWSTWHYTGNTDEKVFMLTYPPFIEACEAGQPITDELTEQFMADFVARFGDEDTPYTGGLRDLTVVEVDSPFIVTEYDGSENIQTRDNTGWFDPSTF